MTTKKGIKIIRHMLPDSKMSKPVHIKTDRDWLFSKKQADVLKSFDDILYTEWKIKNEDTFQIMWDMMYAYYHNKGYKKNHPIITGITA